MNQPIALYAVVCTKLHLCIGPFHDLHECIGVANAMTMSTEDKCRYVPVPMNFRGVLMDDPSEMEGNTYGDWPGAGRGYL